jgi:hypothetical protein
VHKEFELGFVGAVVAAAPDSGSYNTCAEKKPGGEIKFSSRVNVWVLAPKSFGAVKRTNALVLLFLR